MTIESLIQNISDIETWILLIWFSAPPVAVWIIGRVRGREHGAAPPWNYVYSFFVYLVCIPGMFSCVLTGYAMFFVRQNLLLVNFFVYFFPVLCMILTLVIVRKQVNWNELPGVDRLYALMILIAVSFGMALAIYKSRVWIFFGGTIASLLILVVFFFALLKWGMYMLFRSKDEPKKEAPSYSDFSSRRGVHSSDAAKELRKIKKKMGIRD
jgi:hypothetical protein